jgi:2-hydroxycyclohexanecarboxyl-CoA dehydrogenase
VTTPRVALVTGAASGIGLHCVRRLRADGWTVAGADLRPSTAADLNIEVDVSDVLAVKNAVNQVTRDLGAPTTVVSAAGYVEEIPLEAITPDRFEAMLRVHLGGLIALVAAAYPGMREQTGGSFIAIASELALAGGDDAAHYVAAKGAIIGFIHALAVDGAPDRISATIVAPGPTDTGMLAAGSLWRTRDYLDTLPTRELVRTAEIAATVSFLATSGHALTGEIISPNAGTVI